MKTAAQIEAQIKGLKDQLETARRREREVRIARLLSALDKSGLSDDEALTIFENAVRYKSGESV